MGKDYISIYIPYVKWKIIRMFETTNQRDMFDMFVSFYNLWDVGSSMGHTLAA
jgi:hypothetical protein